MSSLTPEAYAVIEGRHSDPFRYLGPHLENGASVVRVFLPDAEEVAVIDDEGHERDLKRIHDAGLFEGRLGNGPRHYRLRARYGDRQVEIEDPYRFPPILSDFDLYLLGEGTHMHPYEKLGAHPMVLDGVEGVAFAVFAPAAIRLQLQQNVGLQPVRILVFIDQDMIEPERLWSLPHEGVEFLELTPFGLHHRYARI